MTQAAHYGVAAPLSIKTGFVDLMLTISNFRDMKSLIAIYNKVQPMQPVPV